jgi:hypothetical protein
MASGACALALGVAGAVPSAAVTNAPIDDFEVVGFDLEQTGFGSQSDLRIIPPPFAGHVISSTRHVNVSVARGISGHAAAYLAPGTAENDRAEITATANGAAALEYSFGGIRDLTAGGSIDRIEMDVTSGAMHVVCWVSDSTGFDSQVGVVDGPELLRWDLAAFGVDVTRATAISFVFVGPDVYLVREARLRGTGSGPISFVEQVLYAQVPPLPSPPLRWQAWDTWGGQPLYDASVSIAEADAGFTPPLEFRWEPVQGLGGDRCAMDLEWTHEGPFFDTHFAFAVDVSPADGLIPEIFPPDPIYPPDPVHGEAGAALAFPILLRESPGGPIVGVSDTWLTLDAGPGQGVEFQNGTLTEHRTAPGAPLTGFTVAFDLILTGEVNASAPLVTGTWIGDWTTLAATGAASPVAVAGGGLRLSAAPSVTRGPTEIRASRPLAGGATVLIHDVAGRRVRALPAATGSSASRWDGRGEGGAPVPAGVYFARLDHGSGGSARIVVVR